MLLPRKCLAFWCIFMMANTTAVLKEQSATPTLLGLLSFTLGILETVFHDQIVHLVNEILILISWWLTKMLVTVNWSLTIYKLVKPLFDLYSPHVIVAESLLNSTNCFSLDFTKLLAKLDAVMLLNMFHHCILHSHKHQQPDRNSHQGKLREVNKVYYCAWFTFTSWLQLVSEKVLEYFFKQTVYVSGVIRTRTKRTHQFCYYVHTPTILTSFCFSSITICIQHILTVCLSCI